jgi:dTDP-glucose 4,6-dehydratase/UDP-glucuronate decarboxylase
MSNTKIIESDCREILSRIDFKKIRNKKILITGATGFLGQYLVSALSLANREMKLKAKIRAVGFSAPRETFAQILKNDPGIVYSRIDLSKNFRLEGFDYIFHAAGYGQPTKFINDPVSVIRINIDATIKLLQASPKATFVFFSSAEAYGDIPQKLIPVSEDYNGNCPLHIPRSVYSESKRLGEALCAAYSKKFGTNIKIIRISHTYGPSLPLDDARVMSQLIKKALTEKKVSILDQGKAVKTYCYIADMVTMILFVGLHGQDMVYNVGGKDSISVLNLAKKIAKNCKVPFIPPTAPSNLSHIGKDPKIVRLNLSKISKEMKKNKFLPFSEGLARTIEWTRSQVNHS